MADGRYVTAFIHHRLTSAGPDLSHEGREIPDGSRLSRDVTQLIVNVSHHTVSLASALRDLMLEDFILCFFFVSLTNAPA